MPVDRTMVTPTVDLTTWAFKEETLGRIAKKDTMSSCIGETEL